MSNAAKTARREYLLSEIDAWRSGSKETVGCPAMGERYALRMRLAIAKLDRELATLGAVKLCDVCGCESDQPVEPQCSACDEDEQAFLSSYAPYELFDTA